NNSSCHSECSENNDENVSNIDDPEDYFEEDLYLRDPALFRVTEQNRQIGADTMMTPATALQEQCHYSSHKLDRQSPGLAFSEPPLFITKVNSIEVTFYYGQLPGCAGRQSDTKEWIIEGDKRKKRRYMFMCDFGEESMYALRWGIGTLLRDGDEVDVVSVIHTNEEV
ncbi:hypothetical protein BDF20DRAFT_805859, partial [Mycotypha africana]|uniref:uncharacterized protein n=1 Tax=Mycotypha africana TaxID=64632 RepID=UPI002300F68D